MSEFTNYAYILNQLPTENFYGGSRIDHPITNKGKVYDFLKLYIYIMCLLKKANELSILMYPILFKIYANDI